MRTRTAIVVGGSLAGLFAGSILAREGWSVRIFERATSDLETRGAGIATHDELFDAFRRAGAVVDDGIGIAVEGRTAFDRQGGELSHFPYRQFLTSWRLLYRRLRAACPDGVYDLGREVAEVVDGDDRAIVVLADGTRLEADLVVGADGTWSQVRASVNPKVVPQYAGYVAWRGLVEEADLPTAFRERYHRVHGFYIARNEQVILYCVAGSDDSIEPGRRRFTFLWYRATDGERELPDLLTDIDGRREAYSISPPRIQKRHVEKLHDDAARLLPPDMAMMIRATPRPFLQSIVDLESDRIGFRHVALVGDAAFVARPHVGVGVSKAGSDVIALADALERHDSVPDALLAYDAARMPVGRALVAHGRYLGSYLEGDRAGGGVAVLPAEHVIRVSAMPYGRFPLGLRNRPGDWRARIAGPLLEFAVRGDKNVRLLAKRWGERR